MVSAGEIIFALEDDDEMVVMRTSRSALDVVKRYAVADSATWAQPAISSDRIYVKDLAHLTLWTVR